MILVDSAVDREVDVGDDAAERRGASHELPGSCRRCTADAWALTITLDVGVEPVRDRPISGPLKFRHRFTSVYSFPGRRHLRNCRRRRGPLRAALVQQDHERLDALLVAQLVHERVDRLTSGLNSSPSTALGVTTVGVSLKVRPMNATLALPTCGPRRAGRSSRPCLRRRRSPPDTRTPSRRTGRAVLAAVDRMAAIAAVLVAVAHPLELVDALVELVVADSADVHADRVQRLDRGLVVEERRHERLAPIRSPAPTVSVLGASTRSILMCVAR